MAKFKFIFFFLFLFTNVWGYTQTTDEDEYVVKKVKKMTPQRKNKKNVSKAIKQLKAGGAVIYIVKDRKTKTDAMKEKGMEAKALELEAQRMQKQKVIVKGLAAYFKFCPVYFVMQSDVEKIQRGEYAGNFVDTSLVRNSSISFNHPYFLFLDYGNVYDETGKVYCDTCVSDVTGKTSLKNDSFVFKNKYLSQLTDPFPYFITCHYPAKEMAAKMQKMNERLHKFHARVAE